MASWVMHIPGMNISAYRTTYEEIVGKYLNKKGYGRHKE